MVNTPACLRSMLLVTALVFIIFGSPAESTSEVPFTIEGGQIIIKAKIKKDVAVEAAVVTGSPYSYMHPDVLYKLELPIKYTNDGPVTGRNDRVLFFSELSGVVVGNEKPVSLYLRNGMDGTAAISLAALSKETGREIAVALGSDFFKGRIVQLDFKAKVLRFLDAPPFDYKTPPANDAGVVRSIHRMESAVDTFYGGRVPLPVVRDVIFGETKLRAIFDTGIPYPFLLSPSMAKQFSLTPPDKGMSSSVTLKFLKAGAAEFTDVPGLLLGKGARPFDNERDYDAVIGLSVMQYLRLTIDWKKDTIVIER